MMNESIKGWGRTLALDPAFFKKKKVSGCETLILNPQ